MSVSTEERICQADTQDHRHEVRNNLNVFILEFLKRGEKHDLSKLHEPELAPFTEHGKKLHALTFNKEDYNNSLKELEPALRHHYAKNRHHPEHFENGVDDMNLPDVCEMFADIVAASRRQDNGNIRLTLDEFAAKHKICPQLLQILENTIDLFDE